MPELPDVESFRNYLNATALHKRVSGVAVRDTDLVKGVGRRTLQRALTGAELEKTCRHGKHLGVGLDTGRWLMLHFGMTGYLDYAKTNGDPPDHTRVTLEFSNGYRLAYVNQRKLGHVRLADDFDAFIADKHLGPDALTINREQFTDLLTGGRGPLKTRLMNQSVIAGLGHVYTDEIFFQAGVHPGLALDDVTPKIAAELWRIMRRVLRTAIDRRGDPQSLPDSWLTPNRDDERCPRCNGALEQARLGGRTSRLCPRCQGAS